MPYSRYADLLLYGESRRARPAVEQNNMKRASSNPGKIRRMNLILVATLLIALGRDMLIVSSPHPSRSKT